MMVSNGDHSPAQAPPALRMFDCSTHLMHGVLHYNGFGHLARINGDASCRAKLQACNLWCDTCRTQHPTSPL